jgi:hypothetical protein
VTQPRTRSHSADALQAGGFVRVARRVRPGYSRGIGADPHFVPDDPVDPTVGFTAQQAAELLGAHLLVGVKHYDSAGELVLTTEFDGYIEEVRDDGVAMRRVDSGEIEWLPPLADGYERAAPGTYTPVCVV